jgi:hypothetical protein
MRRMWLWVLLYALVIGILLFVMGIVISTGYTYSHPTSVSANIAKTACLITIIATVGGFFGFLVGFISLLVHGKAVASLVAVLIGIGLYHVAAAGVVVAAAISWKSPWATLILIVITAVVASLPGFFIARSLRRA